MRTVQAPAGRIRVLAVGGTIATTGSAVGEGGQSVMGAADVVGQVGAAVEAADVLRTPSFSLVGSDLLTIARAVGDAYADGCSGVVVTHGTDTIEETAYFLALTVPRGRPLVLTGAMRAADAPGADGPGNLAAALVAAASPRVAALGPVVVMDDALHAARLVTKDHASRPSAFVSAGAGPVGEVVEGRVDTWFSPAYEDHLGRPETLDGLRVPLIAFAPDDDAAQCAAAVAAGAHGVVLEGTGGGHIAPALLDVAAAAVADGLPVVVASRAGAGSTLQQTYASRGGDADLHRRGFLGAGRLTARKARLRLLVALALGVAPHSIFPVR